MKQKRIDIVQVEPSKCDLCEKPFEYLINLHEEGDAGKGWKRKVSYRSCELHVEELTLKLLGMIGLPEQLRSFHSIEKQRVGHVGPGGKIE